MSSFSLDHDNASLEICREILEGKDKFILLYILEDIRQRWMIKLGHWQLFNIILFCLKTTQDASIYTYSHGLQKIVFNSRQLQKRILCKSQKDKLRGVTFPYINSNMKIVLHVPERLQGDMDKGDICSERWIAWYPPSKSTHKASLTLFVKASSCILCYIYLCLQESAHIYTGYV